MEWTWINFFHLRMIQQKCTFCEKTVDTITEKRAWFLRKCFSPLVSGCLSKHMTQRMLIKTETHLYFSCCKAELTSETASLSRGVTLILCDLIQITWPVHQLASMRSFESVPFFLLPAVNHKQQPFHGAITCTCQHPFAIPCSVVTSSPRLNLSLLILHSLSSSSFLHPIFRLLPEYVMVHGEAEGYGFVLTER